MAGLLQDIRYALRQLRKSPGFAITAVLMLALGICANGTVFSWINATLLHPVPGARNTGELVSIMRGQWTSSPSPPMSYPDYRDLRDANHTFSGILAYHHDWLTLTGSDTPQRVYVANASANYFDVLGIKPLVGRFFHPEEEARKGGDPYVVLGYALWQTRFGGDPAIVGKTIEISRHTFTVIGVAPEGFIGCMPAIRTDAWLTLNATTDPGSNDWLDRRSQVWGLNVVGRLKPSVSRAQATRDLEVLMQRLVAEYPGDHVGVNTITLDPMWRSPFGANGYLAASLPILMILAGVVLLLTCANIATLALVRFVARRRDIAIRQALGANRIELMRQMILEGLLVSLFGGVLAIELTTWSSKSLALMIPPNSNPIAMNGYVDFNVAAGTLLLALLCSVICGALPAWRSSHVAAADVLKDEAGSVSAGAHNRHLLSCLVVAQIALSLVLCIASGLFLRTLRNASEADPGFEKEHILTASVDLASSGFSNQEIRSFQHNLFDKVQTLPGISSASLTDWVPLSFGLGHADAYPEGYVPQPHESLDVRRAAVSAGYFDTMSIPILEGRAFTRDDNENAPPVIIVDETAANHYWPGQNPLGRRLHIYNTFYTVVGVARNSKHEFVSEPPQPIVFFSFFQVARNTTTIQLRTQGDPRAFVAPLEDAVHQVNSKLPLYDVRTLRETMQISMVFQRIEAVFATIFGLLALVLATTGIYGVVAYRTQLRTQEIGIRVALGASHAGVLRLVLYQGVQLAAAGLVLGLAVAFALTRFLRGMLYGVSASDPLTAICVTALLAAIAVLACYLPAVRAMRTDPVTAIRAR